MRIRFSNYKNLINNRYNSNLKKNKTELEIKKASLFIQNAVQNLEKEQSLVLIKKEKEQSLVLVKKEKEQSLVLIKKEKELLRKFEKEFNVKSKNLEVEFFNKQKELEDKFKKQEELNIKQRKDLLKKQLNKSLAKILEN